jgi:hypothetical protein
MKYAVFILVAFLSACSSASKTDIVSNTVSVTNLSQTSGGSGSIIWSSTDFSYVLTNAHVCKVVQNGGVIGSESGVNFVLGFKISRNHDLCLIKVSGNLHAKAEISKEIPKPYDFSTVSGHPHLLPTIVNKGHFSGRSMIQVMIGIRACEQSDIENSNTAAFCIMFGKLPIIRSYEGVAVSNLIQPGSSGSGVYTEAGEIGAVIFAGEGDIGYGYAVPLEYIHNFLEVEAPRLPLMIPNMTLNLTPDLSEHDFIKKVSVVCSEDSIQPQIKEVCSWIKSSIKIYDYLERK